MEFDISKAGPSQVLNAAILRSVIMECSWEMAVAVEVADTGRRINGPWLP
jgi:hypothetical protein